MNRPERWVELKYPCRIVPLTSRTLAGASEGAPNPLVLIDERPLCGAENKLFNGRPSL
jgi:hypothetical protein